MTKRITIGALSRDCDTVLDLVDIATEAGKRYPLVLTEQMHARLITDPDGRRIITQGIIDGHVAIIHIDEV